jgi:hypothetical protein
MSVPPIIAEAALAAVTAGVEAALAADRRSWGHRLLKDLSDLPVGATSQRELLASLAEEFYAAADEIDHGGHAGTYPSLMSAPR